MYVLNIPFNTKTESDDLPPRACFSVWSRALGPWMCELLWQILSELRPPDRMLQDGHHWIVDFLWRRRRRRKRRWRRPANSGCFRCPQRHRAQNRRCGRGVGGGRQLGTFPNTEHNHTTADGHVGTRGERGRRDDEDDGGDEHEETGDGAKPIRCGRYGVDTAGGDRAKVRRAGDEAHMDIRHDVGGHRHGVRHNVGRVLQVLRDDRVQTANGRSSRPKPVAGTEHR